MLKLLKIQCRGSHIRKKGGLSGQYYNIFYFYFIFVFLVIILPSSKKKEIKNKNKALSFGLFKKNGPIILPIFQEGERGS